MTAQSHETICEKVTARAAAILAEKLNDSLEHHRQMVRKEFEIVMLAMKSTVAEAVKEIKTSNGQKKE